VGLPWCQHTCPMCQWAAHALSRARAPHLPTFNAVVQLASRRRLAATGHVVGLALAVASSGARGGTGPLLRWEGRSGSPRLAQARRPLGVQLPHVGARSYQSTGGGPETVTPAVSPRPYAPSSKGLMRGYR
jgi:hypothetical protein